MKLKNYSGVGLLLLGAGVLIFSLTFLHLYLTKIYPDNKSPGYVDCNGANGTVAIVYATSNLKGVVVTALPNNEQCRLGDMSLRTSDVCVFNNSASFVRVEYEGGKFAQECYFPKPIPA